MFFNRLNTYKKREDGFTLVELLIVVLIIGILAAVAIPVYLGLQNNAKNSATKQDVNSAVHKIQVAITEGQDVTSTVTANTDSANRSDGTKVVTTLQTDNKNYTVTGTQKDTGYTYTYDSTTGVFTEGTTDIALGGGNQGTNTAPAFTSTAPTSTATVGTPYSFTVTASGSPAPKFTVTTGSLPAGLTLNANTGVLAGTPTTAGTSTFTITADNSVTTPATQNGTITVTTAVASTWDFENTTEGFSIYSDTYGTYGTLAASTTQHNTGSYALKGTGNANGFIAFKAFTGLTVGQTYTVTTYIYAATGVNSISATLVNSAQTNSYGNKLVNGNGAWQKATLTFTYFAGEGLQLSHGANQTVYYDSITVTG